MLPCTAEQVVGEGCLFIVHPSVLVLARLVGWETRLSPEGRGCSHSSAVSATEGSPAETLLRLFGRWAVRFGLSLGCSGPVAWTHRPPAFVTGHM